MSIDDRIRERGYVLPATAKLPASHRTAFSWVRIFGDRVLVSGHGPQALDGSPAGPFGRVPDEVSLKQAQASARLAALSVIASVREAVDDLERVDGWLTVTGFVQAEPGYAKTTLVLNTFSDVVLDIFGPTIGEHARTAIGVVALPLNLLVVVAAELHLRPQD